MLHLRPAAMQPQDRRLMMFRHVYLRASLAVSPETALSSAAGGETRAGGNIPPGSDPPETTKAPLGLSGAKV